MGLNLSTFLFRFGFEPPDRRDFEADFAVGAALRTALTIDNERLSTRHDETDEQS